MSMSNFARDYHERMFPGYKSDFRRTDPQFIAAFDNFAFDEVIHTKVGSTQVSLDDHTRLLSNLAVLLGCQGIDEYRALLPAALRLGVRGAEVKEMIYQAVAYLGIGRVFPFLKAANEGLEAQGIPLPVPSEAADEHDRLQDGVKAQCDIFGESMRDFYRQGDADSSHLNYWLTDNCFGDYYTRGTLSLEVREYLTLLFLAAQGGCEEQLLAHAKANLRLGNSKDFLIALISANVPFIRH
ncbi:MAG: carboxymuconolactone decarboxylase family protein [Succinivibrio sp.]|nr:carboxymuconolactone decarboxylase family protein [Succinivibrio sp.]